MWRLLFFLLLAQDQPAFHSDVALVHVDAEVRQHRQTVAGLGKESFRVTDNGKTQTILYLGRQEEPLDVVLLFDVSAETRPAIQRVTEATHTALGDLRQGDRIAVMASGRTPEHCEAHLIADFTGDFDSAERSIGRQAAEPDPLCRSCEILTGIDGAAQQFLRQPNGNRRRAIIVITDDQGAGTAPGLVRNTVRDLWKADAVVLGVLVHSGNWVVSIGPPHRGARYAADKTGGDTLHTGDAVEGLRETIQRLRLRYSLYYALPRSTPGEERKIRVQLSSDAVKRYPGATVRARTGYVAPGADR